MMSGGGHTSAPHGRTLKGGSSIPYAPRPWHTALPTIAFIAFYPTYRDMPDFSGIQHQ